MPLFLVILLTPFKYLDLNLEEEDDFESAMLGEELNNERSLTFNSRSNPLSMPVHALQQDSMQHGTSMRATSLALDLQSRELMEPENLTVQRYDSPNRQT